MNQFSFVGEIRPIKDSANFKGYEETSFNSGWQIKKLRFNMVCGDNRHLVEVSAGGWKDANKNVIYTFSAGKDGEKGEKMQVKWADRQNPDVIDKVANFRKYVVDLNTPGALKAAQEAGDEAAIEAAKKRRKEFISEVDMVDYLNKLVNSDKIKGIKFRVVGNIEYSYSVNKNQFYRSFAIQKVYRAADDAESASLGTIDTYFGKDCIDDAAFDDTKKYYVSAHTQFFENNNFKKNIFAPIQLVIDANGDDKAAKIAEGLKKKFDKIEGDEVRKICVAVKFLDGAQRRDISYDDLTDDQKESIDFGLVTLQDIAREMSDGVYGDHITATQIIGLARGYSGGSVDTVYTVDDLALPTLNVEEDKSTATTDDLDDEFDIFGEDF